MILEVWDCAGQPHFQGLCDGYYLSAKAAVVMFSLTDDQSVQSLPKRIDDLIRVVDTHYEEIPDPHTQEEVCQRVRVLDIPWVIVGNQVDHPTDRVDIRRQDKLLWLKHSSFVQSWQGSNFASYHISTMSGYNFNQPFLFLLRRLSGFSDLEIVPNDILLSQPDQMTSLKEVGTNNTSQSTSNELYWESTFEFESEFDTFEENPSWSFSFDPTPIISNLFPIDVDFQFTPEECALVEGAWETQKDPQEILASCFGRNLRRQDLLCLKDAHDTLPLEARSKTETASFTSSSSQSEPAVQSTSTEDSPAPFKIVVLGSAMVGKTQFCLRISSGCLGNDRFALLTYLPSLGATRIIQTIKTTLGEVDVELWDVSGDARLSGDIEGYIEGADAFIFMFDLGSPDSYAEISGLYHKAFGGDRSPQKIPHVLVGNKSDCYQRVKPQDINFHRKKSFQYYSISTLSGYSFGRPLRYLLSQLYLDSTLNFVEHPIPLASWGFEGSSDTINFDFDTWAFPGANQVGESSGIGSSWDEGAGAEVALPLPLENAAISRNAEDPEGSDTRCEESPSLELKTQDISFDWTELTQNWADICNIWNE